MTVGFTPNEIFDLRLKYKNDQDILKLLDDLKESQKAFEEISNQLGDYQELESDKEKLEEELSDAQTEIESLEDQVSDLENENQEFERIMTLSIELINLLTKPDEDATKQEEFLKSNIELLKEQILKVEKDVEFV